jgi:hypothetical protein
MLSLFMVPANFEIEVTALFEGGSRAVVATIRGSRTPWHTSEGLRTQPILVTTLGRSGSTWFTYLLSQHPQVLAWQPFQYDTRTVQYWLSLLTALAESASYKQILFPYRAEGTWWAESQRPAVEFAELPPEVERVLAGGTQREVMSLCVTRVQSFYDTISKIQSKQEATHFVEKCSLGFVSRLATELYPSSRELVLVRDFRDTLCSMIAYNRARGQEDFRLRNAFTAEQNVAAMRTMAEELLLHVKSQGDRALLVRYEELITDERRTLNTILDFIGLDRSADTVAQMIERAAALSGTEAHMTAASASASIGRWRSEENLELRQLCETAFSDLLPEFGYH